MKAHVAAWTLTLTSIFTPFLEARLVRAEEPANPIRASLQPYVDRHALAGAVTIVAGKDRVLSLDTVGFADVQAGKPMAADALFWVASQSKPITATAFMMLVDEGKVALDDPVEKYLPEFHDQWLAVEKTSDRMVLKKPAHPITIREILSHTSGLPFSSAAERPTLDLLPLRVGTLTYAMTPLQFEPGSKYTYSNAGINTAGRIIEVVANMPYETFLSERLFRPLGMTDTTFFPNESQIARIAKSYRPNAERNNLVETEIGQLSRPYSDSKRCPMPAGGLFSTARDLALFCQMILNGGEHNGKRYLARRAVEEMTRKQTPDGVKEEYGLGWSTGGGEFGHGGAFSTNMTIDPKRGLIFIYLVQHEGFPLDGDKAVGAFRQAAAAEFGEKSR